MADTGDTITDVAASILLAPIGFATCALRSGMTLLEGAIHASEALHAHADARRGNQYHRELLETRIEELGHLLEVNKLEIGALRSDVARLTKERDAAREGAPFDRKAEREALKAKWNGLVGKGYVPEMEHHKVQRLNADLLREREKIDRQLAEVAKVNAELREQLDAAIDQRTAAYKRNDELADRVMVAEANHRASAEHRDTLQRALTDAERKLEQLRATVNQRDVKLAEYEQIIGELRAMIAATEVELTRLRRIANAADALSRGHGGSA